MPHPTDTGLPEQIDIESATESLRDYWATYDRQHGYTDYRMETFLNDAIYGIGVAMGEQYRFADGYTRFKRDLARFLHENPDLLTQEQG